MLALGFIVLAFLVDTVWGYAMVAALLALAIAPQRVPLRTILRGPRPPVFILIFTFVLNLSLARGRGAVALVDFFHRRGGVRTAVRMALRLTLLVAGTSLLTLTTSPLKLTDGLESLLRLLKVVKFRHTSWR